MQKGSTKRIVAARDAGCLPNSTGFSSSLELPFPDKFLSEICDQKVSLPDTLVAFEVHAMFRMGWEINSWGFLNVGTCNNPEEETSVFRSHEVARKSPKLLLCWSILKTRLMNTAQIKEEIKNNILGWCFQMDQLYPAMYQSISSFLLDIVRWFWMGWFQIHFSFFHKTSNFPKVVFRWFCFRIFLISLCKILRSRLPQRFVRVLKCAAREKKSVSTWEIRVGNRVDVALCIPSEYLSPVP